MTFKSILPPNATTLEKAIEKTINQHLGAIPTPIGSMWNPNTCPLSHLPWLAWALSVDVWDDAWPETIKRNVVANALKVHALKGTRGALEKALKSQGFGIDISEWWEQSPQGQPNTYKAVLNVINRPLNKKQTALAERTFNQTKRHSQQGTLSFALQSSPTEIYMASAIISGSTITVYPA